MTEPGLHADGGGLYLRVESSGAKRWTFIFRYQNRRCEMGLGSLLAVSLAEARTAAQEARQAVASGSNPIAARRRKAAAKSLETFGAMAEQVIETQSSRWTSGPHLRQWETGLRVHAILLQKRPIAEISTEDVLGVLKPIWLTKAETARKLRGKIEFVRDFAKAKGAIPQGVENPARWKGHLALLLPCRPRHATKHHAALHYDDMPFFLQRTKAAGQYQRLGLGVHGPDLDAHHGSADGATTGI